MTGRSTVPRLTAILLAIGLVATACGPILGSSGYSVQAQFPATFNLFPGSPVKVLGLEVGRISDIAITPDSDLVTVTMQVDESIDLPADVNAVVIPESLLGERYVQFDPPYTGGPTLQPGGLVPIERTSVPFEFDEVLEGLNRFVGGIDADSFGELFTNLAESLEGQGGELGETIDAAEAALGVLRDNDEELIALASRLADLNETLATRDQQIGEIIRDFADLSRVLADEHVNLDRALGGLLRLTDELDHLLTTHREDLQEDLETLTRVSRTAQRNLDQLSLLVLSSAELYRHADRVVDREHNFLPLLNHFSELANEITRTVGNRLAHVCNSLGLGDICDDVLANVAEIVDQLCLPIFPCAEAETSLTLPEAMEEIVKVVPPEVGEEIVEQNREQDTGLADVLQDTLDGVLGGGTGDEPASNGEQGADGHGGLLDLGGDR